MKFLSSKTEILEAKKTIKNSDLFIVELENLSEEKLEDINKYCESFNRVFNLSNNESKYTNQTLKIKDSICYKELNIEDIPYLFLNNIQQTILNKFKDGFNERDILETINNEYYIYLDFNNFIVCSSDFVEFLRKLAKQKRKSIIIGNSKFTKDMYTVLRSFDINCEYDLNFIF